jgi:tryptophan synthase beta chain
MKTYQVNKEGYYGEFGGAYIPEILHRCVEELQNAYSKVLESEGFKQEFHQLLRDYVGRPSPLYLANRLSKKYGCKIYLKREDLNHTGAHKINNAIGQVLLAKRMGKKRIIAETGAGQHGVATATVCALMNMQCIVYMGKTDVERQHINVEKMKMLGAEVRPVTSGNMTLKDATNEAIRDWCCHPADTYYVIGSTVGPHPYPDMVARLQSVISEEIKKQLKEQEGREYPDYLMACVGGGSNAAGTIYHYIDDERVQIVLAEAGGKGIDTGFSAATIQLGKMGIIHGAKTLVIQNEDGQIEEPYSISAGLDYPGIGPMHANLAKQQRALVLAINDDEAIRAAFELTRLEGIIPALESAHADVERQHINVEKMKMLGAEVRPVTSGNMTLKDATNEAIRDWCCHPADTYYVIGSTVGPHPYPDMVARLQSVISEEIKKQLKEQEGREYPDYLMACVGGGSNAAGTIYHYIDDERVQIVLAEAGGKGIDTGFSAATIQLGKMGIIHGAKTLVIQNEDGQIEEPYSISAGLDYPGIGPMHANLAKQQRALVLAINDDEAIRAAFELTRLEGIIPALESAHALGALDKMRFKPTDIVVLTVSGRGDKDIETYLKESGTRTSLQ